MEAVGAGLGIADLCIKYDNLPAPPLSREEAYGDPDMAPYWCKSVKRTRAQT